MVHVTGQIYVAPHGDLYIAPGSTLIFEQDGGILVDRGGFKADGSEDQPITLKGQRNATGWWKGVAIKNGRRDVERSLSHTTIRSGGSAPFEDSEPGALVIFEGLDQVTPITAALVTIQKHANYGVVINSPTAQGSETCSLSGLTFEVKDGYSLYLNGGGSCLRQTDETYQYRRRALVAAMGTAHEVAFSDDSYSYFLRGDVNLKNQNLWVGSGVQLIFREDALLTVEGESQIHGGQDPRAALTSLEREHWRGLKVEAGSTLNLTRIDVEGAGARSPHEEDATDLPLGASITVAEGAFASISDVTMNRTAGFGIRADDGAELRVDSTVIRTENDVVAAAVVGWPAVQGFVFQNDFRSGGWERNVISFETALDVTQTDVDLKTGDHTYLLRVPALRGLRVAAGNRLRLEEDANLQIGNTGLWLDGSAEAPIVVECSQSVERWGTLRILGSDNDHSARHTVFRRGGAGTSPVIEVASGSVLDVTGTAFISSGGPGLHVEDGAEVSGCRTMVFEQHSGDEVTGAPCVDQVPLKPSTTGP